VRVFSVSSVFSLFPFSFLRLVASNMISLSLFFFIRSLHRLGSPSVDQNAHAIIHNGSVVTPRSPSGVQEELCRQPIFMPCANRSTRANPQFLTSSISAQRFIYYTTYVALLELLVNIHLSTGAGRDGFYRLRVPHNDMGYWRRDNKNPHREYAEKPYQIFK
jgi:hypothetical protein